MQSIIFDFETTGINFQDKTIPQRAIQLAWIIIDQNTEIIDQKNYYISGNTEINTDFHQHLSVDFLNKNGVDVKTVIDLFHKDVLNVINSGGFLIAHNIDFDYKVYRNELFVTNGIQININPNQKLCTMKSTTDYCKLPSRYMPRYELRNNNKKTKLNYKYPKLIELYVTLFGSKPKEQLHDAMNDVMVTFKCYRELKKRKII